MKQPNSQNVEIRTLERIAREYTDPDPGRKVEQKLSALIVKEILPAIKGPDVLEMGFGDGEWTTEIVEKFGRSSVVDASETLLKRASTIHGERIQTFSSLFENFSPRDKFDSIIASNVLEHVEDPVLILKRMREWLKLKGKVIILVPNSGSLHRLLAVAMGLQKEPGELGGTDIRMGHRRVYSLQSLEKDVANAGYSIIERRGLFVKLLPQSMMTSFSDEMLRGMMRLSSNIPIEYATSICLVCSANG